MSSALFAEVDAAGRCLVGITPTDDPGYREMGVTHLLWLEGNDVDDAFECAIDQWIGQNQPPEDIFENGGPVLIDELGYTYAPNSARWLFEGVLKDDRVAPLVKAGKVHIKGLDALGEQWARNLLAEVMANE